MAAPPLMPMTTADPFALALVLTCLTTLVLGWRRVRGRIAVRVVTVLVSLPGFAGVAAGAAIYLIDRGSPLAWACFTAGLLLSASGTGLLRLAAADERAD